MKGKIAVGLGAALILMPCFAFFYPLFFGYDTVAGLEFVTASYAGIAANTFEGTRYWIETNGSDTQYIIEATVSHLFDYDTFTSEVNPGTTLELLVDGPSVMGIRVDGVIYLDENDTVRAVNANARAFVIFGVVYMSALATIVAFAMRKKKRSMPPTSNDTQGETI